MTCLTYLSRLSSDSIFRTGFDDPPKIEGHRIRYAIYHGNSVLIVGNFVLYGRWAMGPGDSGLAVFVTAGRLYVILICRNIKSKSKIVCEWIGRMVGNVYKGGITAIAVANI